MGARLCVHRSSEGEEKQTVKRIPSSSSLLSESSSSPCTDLLRTTGARTVASRTRVRKSPLESQPVPSLSQEFIKREATMSS